MKREGVAGLTTFAAMAYILAVNPAILSDGTGMDRAGLVTVTALASAIGTALMAALTKYPIALAPGMGLNALFSYEICGALGVPWQGALGMVFWNGVFFLALTFSGFQTTVVRAIPENLKIGMQVGIGLFIALIGLQQAGILVDHPTTLMDLAPLSDGWKPTGVTLSVFGLLLGAALMVRKIPGALLVSLGAVTILGVFLKGPDGTSVTSLGGIVALPADPRPLLFQADLLYPFKHWELAWMPVLTLLFVDLFDSIGTLVGVSRRAGLVDRSSGELPKMGRALQADAAATAIGSLLGTSPVTAYVESAAGVESGGRTGLTGWVVAGCFLLALFFHPLILAVPAVATGPVLVLVGILMLSGLKTLEWSDLRQVIPAAVVLMFIPFGFGIADGFALGCIAHVILMTATGSFRQVHWLLAVLAILFVLKFAFVG